MNKYAAHIIMCSLVMVGNIFSMKKQRKQGQDLTEYTVEGRKVLSGLVVKSSSFDYKDYGKTVYRLVAGINNSKKDEDIDLTPLEFSVINQYERSMPDNVQAFRRLVLSREEQSDSNEEYQLLDAFYLDEGRNPRVSYEKVKSIVMPTMPGSVQAHVGLCEQNNISQEDRTIMNSFSYKNGKPTIDKEKIKQLFQSNIFGFKIPKIVERVGFLGIGVVGALLFAKKRR